MNNNNKVMRKLRLQVQKFQLMVVSQDPTMKWTGYFGMIIT
jgi:hypothetical protein